MGGYIGRRLLLAVPTLILITVVVFALARFIPGGAVDAMLEQQATSQYPLSRADIEHILGLDVPIHVQYGRWFTNLILHGDMGTSIWTNMPVRELISKKLPVSLELGGMALIVALLIALPIGIYSAVRQDTLGDYTTRSVAIIMLAVPSFWIAILVMIFPAIWWHWSPPMRYIPFVENPMQNLSQFVLPAFIMGTHMTGATMRMTRTMMLETLRQDYIRTAWAKGLRERSIVFRHALKNALIPVVTIVGLQVSHLIGGSVVLENIFNLPGVGQLLFEAVTSRDYPVISGINLVVASFVLVLNLTVDISYAFLDPRVRYK